jgi:hypothetical protein
MLHAVFSRQDGCGLSVPKINKSLDLDRLSVTISTSNQDLVTQEEVVKRVDIMQAVFLPLDILKERKPVLDDRRLVDKIVPYGSRMSVNQSLFVDLITWNEPKILCSRRLRVTYSGQFGTDWYDFWSTLGTDNISFGTPANVLLFDTILNLPPIHNLPSFLVDESAVYIERVDLGNLNRYCQLAQHFRLSWFVSTCYSAFPRPLIHFIGHGFTMNVRPSIQFADISVAILSMWQQLCTREYRSNNRWKWISLFPHEQRSVFTTQADFIAWELEFTERFNRWRDVYEDKSQYCPTSPQGSPRREDN